MSHGEISLSRVVSRLPDFLVVAGLAGLAVLLRAAIQPFIGDTHQFIGAYAAMAAATWLCGWQAGASTALFCGVAGLWFPPVSELDHQAAHVAVAYMAYLGVSMAAVSCVEWLRRERLEAEEAARRLRQSERRTAAVVAAVGHELRAHLAQVVLHTEALETHRVQAGEVARLLPLVRRQTNQMARLLDDLLESSRVETGRLRVNREPLDLFRAVQEAVFEARGSAQEKRQRLTIIRDEEPRVVYADPVRLRQILINLLDSMSKCSPEGSEIHVVVSGREHWTAVSVAEDGGGLTPAQLRELFAPSLDAAAPPVAGGALRLGLPLARELARLHGGNLRAFSAGPGRGLEFLLSLPRALRDGQPAPLAASGAPMPAAPESQVSTRTGLRHRPRRQSEAIAERTSPGLSTSERTTGSRPFL